MDEFLNVPALTSGYHLLVLIPFIGSFIALIILAASTWNVESKTED